MQTRSLSGDARRPRRLSSLPVLALEELWAYVEGILGFLPGRSGRLLRNWALRRHFPAARGIECFVHVRRPQGLTCGRRVSIGRSAQLVCTGGLIIGDEVGIGPNAVVLTSTHDYSDPCVAMREMPTLMAPVHIGDHCWLGAGVVVAPGVSIGARTIVGAGAVVTADLPPDCIAGGVPARVLRSRLAKEPS